MFKCFLKINYSFSGINHISMLLLCLPVFLFYVYSLAELHHAIIIMNSEWKNCDKHFTNYSTWEHRILIDMLKFYAWFYVYYNSMPESDEFCCFTSAIMITKSFTASWRQADCCCVLCYLVLTCWCCVPENVLKIFGEDLLCLNKKQHKLWSFITHSRVSLVDKN